MALTVHVENTSERVLGRMRFRFNPGENGPFEVDADDLHLIEGHPDLTVSVVDADSIVEVRASGIEEVEYNATDSAIKLAEENGVDIFRLTGSGSGGKVVNQDVEDVIVGRPGASGPSPDLSPDDVFAGQEIPTTDDPEEEQEEVEVASKGVQEEPAEEGEHYSEDYDAGDPA